MLGALQFDNELLSPVMSFSENHHPSMTSPALIQALQLTTREEESSWLSILGK
jgi:hypothetical protein